MTSALSDCSDLEKECFHHYFYHIGKVCAHHDPLSAFSQVGSNQHDCYADCHLQASVSAIDLRDCHVCD